MNHQLFQLWEMVHGTFEPEARRYYGKWLSIEPKCIKEIEEHLSLDTNISFCLNDSESIDEAMFPEYKKKYTVFWIKSWANLHRSKSRTNDILSRAVING